MFVDNLITGEFRKAVGIGSWYSISCTWHICTQHNTQGHCNLYAYTHVETHTWMHVHTWTHTHRHTHVPYFSEYSAHLCIARTPSLQLGVRTSIFIEVHAFHIRSIVRTCDLGPKIAHLKCAEHYTYRSSAHISPWAYIRI